jgi:glycosyltransferase involved in cell wall biosynthesis
MLLCGVPAEKLTVVYEAGLAEGYEPEPTDSDTLRNRYKINGPFIMYAGSSMPHKNLRRLIEAFARVAADVRHDLLIVGEPFGFDNGLDRVSASALGLERDRVRMTGFVPRKDLLGLYELADAYVFPSLFEGFGIPVLEAMGIGCPVVAARGTSVPEVAGDAAEYFDPMSVESIASEKGVCRRGPSHLTTRTRLCSSKEILVG